MARIATLRGSHFGSINQPLCNSFNIALSLDLLDDVSHKFFPKTMLLGDGVHFFDESIVKVEGRDCFSKREGGYVRDHIEGDVFVSIFPFHSFNNVGFERNLGVGICW